MCVSFIPPCYASAHPFRREYVAVSVNRPEKSGCSRIRFDLLSQARYRAIERARRARIEETPNFSEQFIAKHDARAALGQNSQNLELAMCEVQITGWPRRGPASEIDG